MHSTVALSAIEHDLIATRELLARSAFSGHKLLIDQTRAIEDVPLARLLLITASLGTYRSDELKTVAIGLELLRLAADTHYPPHGTGVAQSRNLNLVSADYYYAKAIALANRLNKGCVIEHMVKAIAELAKAELSGDGEEAATRSVGGKSLSLFRTAVKLGTALSGCPAGTTRSLLEFAATAGLCYHASRHRVRADIAGAQRELAAVKERALAEIAFLPAGHYNLLKEILSVSY